MDIGAPVTWINRLVIALVIVAIAWVPMPCAEACDHTVDKKSSVEQSVKTDNGEEPSSHEQAFLTKVCAGCFVQIMVVDIAQEQCVETPVEFRPDFAANFGVSPPGNVFRPPIV